MMTLDDAIAKATKLIRLSESSNAHESALAAETAQKILARYNIDLAMLSVDGANAGPEEAIEECDELLDSGNRRLATWKSILSNKVARANSCRTYLIHSDIAIVGRPSDVSKVRYLYQVLIPEVDRLTSIHGQGRGRSYCHSFRIGVVSAIGDKLEEANAKVADEMRAEHTGDALVRVDQALERLAQRGQAVDDWVAENLDLCGSGRSYHCNPDAKQEGYAAGQSINIGGARGALGSGASRLN